MDRVMESRKPSYLEIDLENVCAWQLAMSKFQKLVYCCPKMLDEKNGLLKEIHLNAN